jgi:PhoH-like ATPase
MANKNRNAHVNNKVAEPVKEIDGNVILFDTNVIINDKDCLKEFLKQSNNVVVVARMVILELDKLKNPKSEVKSEARIATRMIYDFRSKKNSRVFISWKQNFSKLDLDKTIPDHNIIATFNHLLSDKRFAGYKKFKLISDDNSMLLIAGELFANNPKVEVAPYNHIRVKVKTPKTMSTVVLKDTDHDDKGNIIFNSRRFRGLKENAGILLRLDDGPVFAAIRKGNKLIPLNIKESVCGIAPMPDKDDNPNWEQAQYTSQLIDPSVAIVLASGVAGTGKTLLALAAALHQRDKYSKIILTRPVIPLEGEETLGFMPGDLNEKMLEYVIPFIQDLEVIIEENSKNHNFFMKKFRNANLTTADLLSGLKKDPFSFLANLNISVNSVQHYKGRTYHKTWIIVDEAQNLTQAQVKTVLTRAGKNSKIVLTGDLDQIDRRFLSAENSGLAHAMVKMNGNSIVGVTHLKIKARSDAADLAEKLL